jgi:hypothetical protein
MEELCPICINREAEYFTECNHGYCIQCLCKLKKCGLCRKPLQKALLCNSIISNSTPKIVPTTTLISLPINRNRQDNSTLFHRQKMYPWDIKTRRLTTNRHIRNICQ